MASPIDPVTHEDLVMLTSWMAKNGYEATEIAYAVEKPWKYADVMSKAVKDEDVID